MPRYGLPNLSLIRPSQLMFDLSPDGDAHSHLATLMAAFEPEITVDRDVYLRV